MHRIGWRRIDRRKMTAAMATTNDICAVVLVFRGHTYLLTYQEWADLANCVHDLQEGQAVRVKYGETSVTIERGTERGKADGKRD
jgi:hypothetical protein